jgi:hypothetical protein
VSATATVEVLKSADRPANSSKLNSLVYSVWSETEQIVYKNQRVPFHSTEFLQQITKNVWRFTLQCNMIGISPMEKDKCSVDSDEKYEFFINRMRFNILYEKYCVSGIKRIELLLS